MRTRSFFALLSVVSLGAATLQACDCGSSNSTSTDAGTQPDGAPGTDAGPLLHTDAGSQPDATACAPQHLPAGYTEVVRSAVDTTFGAGASMALDENDDPMFAYIGVKAAVDTGTALTGCDPHNKPQACDAVYFTRWDPCAGAFTKPIVIDANVNYAGGNPGTLFTQVAYDPSTKEIGVAFVKTLPTDPNWADAYGTINLATMKPGQTSFSVQQVSNNTRWGVTDVSTSDTPLLAMGGGKLYMAFTGGFGDALCGDTNAPDCIHFLSSTTANDPDASSVADAGAVVHYFDEVSVPLSTAPSTHGNPRHNAMALALDSAGNPGLAYYQQPGRGTASYNTQLFFWRPGMVDSVFVTDTNNVQNDLVTLSLAFEGTSPRVAGILSQGTLDGGVNYSVTYAASPDTGTTWSPFIPVENSAGTDMYTSLAAQGGHEAIISHYNSSPPNGCNDPFVATSTSSGASFTGCSATPSVVHLNGSVSSAYGSARLNGKLVIGGSDTVGLLEAGAGTSVLYYQAP